MVDKEKQRKELRLYEHYLLIENVLKNIREDLDRIKKITSLEEQQQEASIALRKHDYKHGLATAHYNNGKL